MTSLPLLDYSIVAVVALSVPATAAAIHYYYYQKKLRSPHDKNPTLSGLSSSKKTSLPLHGNSSPRLKDRHSVFYRTRPAMTNKRPPTSLLSVSIEQSLANQESSPIDAPDHEDVLHRDNTWQDTPRPNLSRRSETRNLFPEGISFQDIQKQRAALKGIH